MVKRIIVFCYQVSFLSALVYVVGEQGTHQTYQMVEPFRPGDQQI
jgi:hypothetical protein